MHRRTTLLAFFALFLALFVGCEAPPSDTASAEAPAVEATETPEETPSAEAAEAPPETDDDPSSAPTTARPPGVMGWIPAGPDILLHLDMQAIVDASAQGTARLFDDADASRTFIAQHLDALGAMDRVAGALGGPLQLSRLRELGGAVWLRHESVLLVVNPEVLTTPPDNGAPPAPLGQSGVQVALRQGYALIGMGPAFEAALGLEDEDHFASFAQVWPEGVAGIPANSVVRLAARNYRLASMPLREELAPLASMEIASIAFGLSTTGAATLVFDAENDTVVRQTLGHAQQRLDGFASAVGERLPPSMEAWHTYAEDIISAIWSRVDLSRDGTITTVSIETATCGNPMRNLFIVALIRGLSQGVEGPADYENRAFDVAPGCVTLRSTAPEVPASLAALAREETGAPSVLALLDPSAIASANLPTLFGLLPVALPAERVAAAFGEDPMGLGGLDDPSAAGIYWRRGDAASDEVFAVVLPEQSVAHLPAPPQMLINVAVAGLGHVIASPSAILSPVIVEGSGDAAPDGSGASPPDEAAAEVAPEGSGEAAGVPSPAQALALTLAEILAPEAPAYAEVPLPEQTAAAFWLNGAAVVELASLLDGLPAAAGMATQIGDARIAITGSLNPDVLLTLTIPVNPLMESQIETVVRAVLEAELMESARHPMERALIDLAVQALAAQMTIETLPPNQIHLSFGRSGSYVAMVALVWAIEHFREQATDALDTHAPAPTPPAPTAP